MDEDALLVPNDPAVLADNGPSTPITAASKRAACS